jgi:hypothetical protein
VRLLSIRFQGFRQQPTTAANSVADPVTRFCQRCEQVGSDVHPRVEGKIEVSSAQHPNELTHAPHRTSIQTILVLRRRPRKIECDHFVDQAAFLEDCPRVLLSKKTDLRVRKTTSQSAQDRRREYDVADIPWLDYQRSSDRISREVISRPPEWRDGCLTDEICKLENRLTRIRLGPCFRQGSAP